jgi:hypothetical protein
MTKLKKEPAIKALTFTAVILLAFLCVLSDPRPSAYGGSDPANGVEDKNSRDPHFEIPFFDGVKLQSTNCHPKLTNANHMIEDINRLTGSSLRDWDTITIQTLDLVLWKDLSKYFKIDVAAAFSSGSLLSSSSGFKGTPFEMGIRMRQRYTVLELWSNLYFYPLTTDVKGVYEAGHIFEPFIAIGFGYTFFRSESVFKLRRKNLFYNRIRNNWNGGEWATKLMTGFNLDLGNATPRLKGWVVTFSTFLIWNRLKGHSSMHLTDGLQLGGRPLGIDVSKRQRMDIDLTGHYFALALGCYF